VINQVRQDVKNSIVGLQQARARYETAVATRVQAQHDLAGDQTNEIQAMANYTHARNAFDEAIGMTLDVNHISMEEAEAGRVARTSSIPDTVPARRP
jgi:outer membrane protein TolC